MTRADAVQFFAALFTGQFLLSKYNDSDTIDLSLSLSAEHGWQKQRRGRDVS